MSLSDSKKQRELPFFVNYINGSVNSSRNVIYSILEDKNKNLWIGTHRGLYKFDRSTEAFIYYGGDPENPQNPGNKRVNCILESQTGHLWIGTYFYGLYKLNPETGIYVQYLNDPENPYSLSNDNILMMHEDRTGFLWIATAGDLNKFDPSQRSFSHYNSNVGLPGDGIFAILDDREGNLWLSSGKGIFRFSPESGAVKSFDKNDGLQSIEFNFYSYFKNKNGWMYFGGINGFNASHPDSIKQNDLIPEIVLTDFQIFNKTVLPGIHSPLKKTISEANEINLTHNQSVFSLEFAALDFHDLGKNQYAYKMEGVDPDWVYTDASRRFATYTQLGPGEYVFRVKGSNNDGIWNDDGTSVKIIIIPPWWQTNLAYSFYVLLFGLIVFGLWRFQTNRLKIKHELELKNVHAEKLEEVDRLKSRFFANISHEFRTPLTLILGPVEQMFSGEFKGNLKEQYKVIIRNAKRLLQLINQLLDLSKLESGKLKLQAQASEIISFTNGLVQAFESLAERKSIALIFQPEIELQEVYIDIEKYETIINNLLSNAFKFTPQGGVVEVLISSLKKGDKGGCIQIAISNTGPGIPVDRIEKIFDRFYQIDNSYTKDEEGTGIGLALTKELIELHHGEIRVESGPDSKTIFTILLPLGKGHLKEDEIAVTAAQDSPLKKGARSEGLLTEGMLKTLDEITEAAGSKPITETEKPKDKPIILIVEDNADLRQYIRNSMDSVYQIMEAENGKEGLAKSTEQIPDLIISDVMMPKMDGFEFCTKIKTDERTSHIPVILLTARAEQADKIEGLETGADDYISKPFDNKELNIRIKNLIEQRRKLRERFAKETNFLTDNIAHTSVDEKFVKRIIDIISQHIHISDFNIESLSLQAGMSRMHLHRKILGLFGQSPGDFLRTIRLKRGAELLKEKTGNISEIAYKVGFDSPAYFSNCFRQQFGLSPSEYVKNLQSN